MFCRKYSSYPELSSRPPRSCRTCKSWAWASNVATRRWKPFRSLGSSSSQHRRTPEIVLPETLSPKPGIRNPKVKTLKSRCGIRESKPPTLNPKPETLYPQPSTFNPQPPARNPKPETLMQCGVSARRVEARQRALLAVRAQAEASAYSAAKVRAYH